MNEIVPTILTSSLEDFSWKINALRGICSRVQVDVVDGKYSPIKTVDLGAIRPSFAEATEGKDLVDWGGLKIDLHLMVEEPQGWISRCLELVPDRIIAQVEKMADPFNFVNEVVESGCQVGLALDLDTEVEKVSEDIYLLADMVLILGVKAGQGGQEFNEKVLEKIKKIREILGENGKIGIDGGVNKENIKLCKEAGANIFCVGTSFWEAENLGKRYNELLTLLNDGR